MKRLTEKDWKDKCEGYPWNVHPVKDIDDLPYYKKLASYEDDEEQGLLLRLPCKIGDTLYRVNKGAKEPVIMMRVIQLYIKQIHKDRTVMRIDAINDADMCESSGVSTIPLMVSYLFFRPSRIQKTHPRFQQLPHFAFQTFVAIIHQRMMFYTA